MSSRRVEILCLLTIIVIILLLLFSSIPSHAQALFALRPVGFVQTGFSGHLSWVFDPVRVHPPTGQLLHHAAPSVGIFLRF